MVGGTLVANLTAARGLVLQQLTWWGCLSQNISGRTTPGAVCGVWDSHGVALSLSSRERQPGPKKDLQLEVSGKNLLLFGAILTGQFLSPDLRVGETNLHHENGVGGSLVQYSNGERGVSLPPTRIGSDTGLAFPDFSGSRVSGTKNGPFFSDRLFGLLFRTAFSVFLFGSVFGTSFSVRLSGLLFRFSLSDRFLGPPFRFLFSHLLFGSCFPGPTMGSGTEPSPGTGEITPPTPPHRIKRSSLTRSTRGRSANRIASSTNYRWVEAMNGGGGGASHLHMN